jgi:hypothetical protein
LWWFENQANGDPPGTPYFPVFMHFMQHRVDPLLTLTQDNASVTDHWRRAEDPLFVPHTSDAGLCWTLLDWRDNP